MSRKALIGPLAAAFAPFWHRFKRTTRWRSSGRETSPSVLLGGTLSKHTLFASTGADMHPMLAVLGTLIVLSAGFAVIYYFARRHDLEDR